MTRMTIATDDKGHLLGAIQHEGQAKQDGLDVSVSFAPGARLHEIEVDSELDMRKVKDVAKFHEALSRHVAMAD